MKRFSGEFRKSTATFGFVLLAAGLAMLGLVVRRMDFAAAALAAASVGTGFVLIIAQEMAAHLLNALGWKYSFTPELSAKMPLGRVLWMRIAGDGINYLTPSATLAGEWARTSMMGSEHDFSQRLASVAIAKITQTAAMAVTSLAGLAWVFAAHIELGALKSQLRNGGGLIAAIIAVIIALEIRAAKSRQEQGAETTDDSAFGKLKRAGGNIAAFMRDYPARFAASAALFLAAYLWGAFEAYWICVFLGAPVEAATAVLIELLSVFMDGIFFAVPGKAGTQEATKTAIFGALGLSAQTGFAFGIVRHIREIVWAATGFGMYYITARGNKKPPVY